MVSINVSKDKFDRIVNRETQEGTVLWIGRPDIFKINFRAKSSLPFSVNLYTNDVKLKSFHNMPTVSSKKQSKYQSSQGLDKITSI